VEKTTVSQNEFLRHTISTIAYRFQKSVRKRNRNFGEFNLGKGARTPIEIINHIYHALNAAKLFIQDGEFQKSEPKKLSLILEIERFNSELDEVEKLLSEKKIELNFSKKLLQGPFSGILSHIGQISMISRLNGNPIDGEDFSSSAISTGTTSYFENEKIT